MEIKKAEISADFEAIEQLAEEIWREHYTPIIGEEQVEYMLRKFQSAEVMQKQVKDGYEYFTATQRGRLTGYFSFRQDKGEIFLSKLYLVAGKRGQGYGWQMMAYIERVARKRHLSGIRLTVNKHNTKSIEAYQKMGFKVTRPVLMDIGEGFAMDDFEMLKKLS